MAELPLGETKMEIRGQGPQERRGAAALLGEPCVGILVFQRRQGQ